MNTRNRHDLSLSDWGPYTKWYAGISHVNDAQKGLRFDLSVFPGFYRRKLDVPNVTWESGYHAWECAPDFSYYSYRCELSWKDRMYADVSFSKMKENARLIRCELVNNEDFDENFVLHYMAALYFPAAGSHTAEPLRQLVTQNAENVALLHALQYDSLCYAAPHAGEGLVSDGLKKGESRGHDFYKGSALYGRGWLPGTAFGEHAGDSVCYTLDLEKNIENAALCVHYKKCKSPAVLQVSGAVQGELCLQAGEGQGVALLAAGNLQAGACRVKLTAAADAEICMDAVYMGERNACEKVEFTLLSANKVPNILDGPTENSLILQYPDADGYYGISWEYDDFWVRQIFNSELDSFMRLNVHHHTNKIMQGDGKGHFTNVFQRPIVVQRHSRRVLYGTVLYADTAQQAAQQLSALHAQSQVYEKIYETARKGALAMLQNPVPSGQSYAFSQQRMAAVTLQNVVFPVYTCGGYIRHNTPGKWWDCLYTWDSGFVGLGLNVLSPQRAAECLSTYTMDEDETDWAFLHHGSMVPVQFYLWNEIWNRTQSEELLRKFYPRMKRYYLYYAGHAAGSTTAQFSSGLLKTWEYFYNSGGWDDYPPQFYCHSNRITPYVTPAVNTSHAIRCAKILIAAARQLGEQDFAQDIALYRADIEKFAGALQTYSWDEQAGYFSYVLHDKNGDPTGILRHESGQNFNMGLDGAEPIITGTLTPAQQQRIYEHLTDPQQIWCDIGLSTVDRTAKYFTIDGYWNGAVWMPHQWFIYKAMLDCGKGDFAYKIAHTALTLWKDEVERSYNCYEHFIVASRRGAGWHQFGGLSTPVLYWYAAYFLPGNLTFGYDTWVRSSQFDAACENLQASLYNSGSISGCVIARMAPGKSYALCINGVPAEFCRREDGAIEFMLPPGEAQVQISAQ